MGAKDRLQSLRGQTGEWIIQIVQARNPYRYRRGIQSSGRDRVNQSLMSQKAWLTLKESSLLNDGNYRAYFSSSARGGGGGGSGNWK